MEIRRAEAGDIPDIAQLLFQVEQVHHTLRPDIFRPGAAKYTPQELEAILQDPERPVLVAVREGRVLGYAFCIRRSFDGSGVTTCRREVYVDDVCVAEDCRGQGIATALVERVYACAREWGCQFVTLNVWEGNDTARRFYEKMGMTPRSTNMEIRLSC